MRKYSNKNSVSYKLIDKDGKIFYDQINTACYTGLRREGYLAEKVTFRNFRCEETNKYTNFFLKYIGDMLELEYELIEDEFTIQTTLSSTANLILGSLVRMLFEGTDKDQAIAFFELLKKGKSKYKNKLERFCDLYSQMPSKYIDSGHVICLPNRITIISIDDFKLLSTIEPNYLYDTSQVNNFFEGKYVKFNDIKKQNLNICVAT